MPHIMHGIPTTVRRNPSQRSLCYTNRGDRWFPLDLVEHANTVAEASSKDSLIAKQIGSSRKYICGPLITKWYGNFSKSAFSNDLSANEGHLYLVSTMSVCPRSSVTHHIPEFKECTTHLHIPECFHVRPSVTQHIYRIQFCNAQFAHPSVAH